MCFLLPYPEELVSSLISRLCERYGMTPKRISRLFLGEENVCHPQNPKLLAEISRELSGELSVEDLICGHTTFPLIAPFLEPEPRHNLWNWLHGRRQDSIRLRALRTPDAKFTKYRFCPRCWEHQEQSLGTRYWLRQWQVPACTVCLRHKTPLRELDESFRDKYGAPNLIWADSVPLSAGEALQTDQHAETVSEAVEQLLNLERTWKNESEIPDRHSWSSFYTESRLARASAGMKAYWGEAWLRGRGLLMEPKELIEKTKRRSWLRHLILLKAIEPEMTLKDLLAYRKEDEL